MIMGGLEGRAKPYPAAMMLATLRSNPDIVDEATDENDYDHDYELRLRGPSSRVYRIPFDRSAWLAPVLVLVVVVVVVLVRSSFPSRLTSSH